MKLCAFCISNILESKEYWDEHHKSYAALKKSADERCLFCHTLYNDIKTLGYEESDEHWPVWRWTIRSLAKIRESLETIVVTFRQIPRESSSIRKVLPTRTFYLFPEADLGPLPTPSELGNTTNPTKKNSSGPQIRSWIESCNATHTACQKRRKAILSSGKRPFVPTRLLDISGEPGSNIRVIETKTTPIRDPYVSLSHCWGLKPFVKLTTEDRKRFTTEGVQWSLLPQNFQDAIEVGRFLDVKYIWIDSLCIVQEGPEGDFASEASKMHSVYRNSYCNIAVVDSEDSTGGAFRDHRKPESVVPVEYRAKDASAMFGEKKWRVVRDDLWDDELLQSFLYRRGWVFQERMLAPRILHFAHRQVFWDCPSMSACETLPAGLPPPMDGLSGPDRHWRGRLQEGEDNQKQLAGASDASLVEFWKTAIAKYTVCNLTMGKDKLIALWGIAKLVRDALHIEYGEGLWEQNLEDQLAWRVTECKLKVRPSESDNEKIVRNVPSWSWASMDGKIEVPDRLSVIPHYTVKDHNNRPLRFDLKGVKYPHAPTRIGDKASPEQARSKSDSVAEMQRHYKETEKEQLSDTKPAKNKKQGSEDDDRDRPPEFYSKSIPIQGHVGRGRLRGSASQQWLLDFDEAADIEIDAFPDTIPDPQELNPSFVVLSAKKVNRHETASESRKPARVKEMNVDWVVSGHGILMKQYKVDHFRRTGAFYFRKLEFEDFEKLRRTYGDQDLSPDMYDIERGRKFWLD